MRLRTHVETTHGLLPRSTRGWRVGATVLPSAAFTLLLYFTFFSLSSSWSRAATTSGVA